jgi:hypothetical protein
MSEKSISIDSVLEKPIGHVPHNSYSEESSRYTVLFHKATYGGSKLQGLIEGDYV